MNLWRPPTRTLWWIAFVASLIVVPTAVVLVAILFVPFLFPLILLLAPLAACYLIAVTRLAIAVRVALVAVLFVGIAYLYLPRSTCGPDEAPDASDGRNVVATDARKRYGCNG